MFAQLKSLWYTDMEAAMALAVSKAIINLSFHEKGLSL
jgi:hypothetical protein